MLTTEIETKYTMVLLMRRIMDVLAILNHKKQRYVTREIDGYQCILGIKVAKST